LPPDSRISAAFRIQISFRGGKNPKPCSGDNISAQMHSFTTINSPEDLPHIAIQLRTWSNSKNITKLIYAHTCRNKHFHCQWPIRSDRHVINPNFLTQRYRPSHREFAPSPTKMPVVPRLRPLINSSTLRHCLLTTVYSAMRRLTGRFESVRIGEPQISFKFGNGSIFENKRHIGKGGSCGQRRGE
jgi:hypothetical protein